MITKEQNHFLKAFIKLAKRTKIKDKQLEFFNREKVNVEDFCILLSNHPELNPAEPFDNREDDAFTGTMLIEYIDSYLEKTGLKDLIDYYSPKRYGISQKGLKEMHDYKVELASKIKLPIMAIVLSCISIIIAIIALSIRRNG